ncbi:MAG: DNA mismatch repair protein MutS [Bacillota bacterium]|nr:DNA mismatch repair protein MutS [Bacillota bacterium]
MNRTSPMMEQYKNIKAQHPDKLLMFQVGDFYEFFYEDARTAAREMDIALTSRDTGSENPIPLAGVPIHAADTYLNKLLGKGFKVVICEQVESSSQAKGLVRREITRILTPGTIIDPEMLEESRNNYLVTLIKNESSYGLAAVDVSTGDFQITEQSGEDAWEIIIDEVNRLQPSEILCSSPELELLSNYLSKSNGGCLTSSLQSIPTGPVARELITAQWGEAIWDDLSLDHYPRAVSAAAAVITYLELLQQIPSGKSHFHHLDLYFINKNMIIDMITSRNLELTQSLREGGKRGSLLGLLDNCLTGMGRRLFRRWIEQPLVNLVLINKRLDSVEELLTKPIQRRALRKKLEEIFDLERFCSKLSFERVNARDLVSLKNTLKEIELLREKICELESELLRDTAVGIPSFDDLICTLEKALVEDPPLAIKEGGLFKPGYNSEVDRLKQISSETNKLLLEFESSERQRTGIKSLRVGYNRNFGYFIEITRSNLNLVPENYHRKQTLVNAERFSTEELLEMEEEITGARDKLAGLEYELFEDLRREVGNYTDQLLKASFEIAKIDSLQGLAESAERFNFSRPLFSENNVMHIVKSRHPVVEQLSAERFVPNDIIIDNKNYILIITGPNMAGKSTYIRSTALIAIMAQMGSFVPAERAELPLFDRLFARVGASDDLSRGHSTFMVEMQETAAILKEATANSLIILDEIGRGTSTYDGMSIARSVIEYLSRKIKAKTLFSTHYHELTNLENELEGIKNYTIAVKEKGKDVIFLRQVIPGKADKSYGINVARLAGVPMEVLIRAETILNELELASSKASEHQLSLLPMVSEPVLDHLKELEAAEIIRELDLNRMTPLEALQKMYELQKQLMEEDNESEQEGAG